MTDSGNFNNLWCTIQKEQRIRQSRTPLLAFVEEIESPSILSDPEIDPFVSCSSPIIPVIPSESIATITPVAEAVATATATAITPATGVNAISEVDPLTSTTIITSTTTITPAAPLSISPLLPSSSSKQCHPNLFDIHNQSQQNSSSVYAEDADNKCFSNKTEGLLPVKENLRNCDRDFNPSKLNDLQRKRKAEHTSPSEIQGQLRSPGFVKTKSKSILFPTDIERNCLYERENVSVTPTKNSKKPKLNKYESHQQDSQNEHEVPSTPPPSFVNDPLPTESKYEDEISKWRAEMSHTSKINRQLTTELQSQLSLLASLLPTFQKGPAPSENDIIIAFENVNHKLEAKLKEYNLALNNLDKNTPNFLKSSPEVQQQQQQIESETELSGNEEDPCMFPQNPKAILRPSNPSSREVPISHPEIIISQNGRSEEEFQELETRISSLEQELSDSRQFITVLGNKVLEMEIKVFQRK